VSALESVKVWLLDLFSDVEDPEEAVYDPVHLGAAILICMVAVGCLYWLLWTLLVFEGGLFLKLSAGLKVLFTSKTAADFGYEGTPYAMGAFEGLFGNLAALALCAVVVTALHRLYRQAALGGTASEDGGKRNGPAAAKK